MSTAEDLVGTTIGERFRVTGVLARGPHGVVYEATDDAGEDRVVKVFDRIQSVDDEAVARMVRETRAVSTPPHPNVAMVHAAGALEDGRPYVVMQRVLGPTLAELVARGEPVAPARVAELLSGVAKALDHGHRMGIAHGALHGRNVVLTVSVESGELAKVLDLGTAAIRAWPPSDDDHVAPEARTSPLAPEADVYALAVLAWQLSTGRPLAEREAEDDASTAAPAIAVELADALARGLAKDPKERPWPVPELVRELRAAAARTASVAPSPARAGTSAPPRTLQGVGRDGGRDTVIDRSRASASPAPKLGSSPSSDRLRASIPSSPPRSTSSSLPPRGSAPTVPRPPSSSLPPRPPSSSLPPRPPTSARGPSSQMTRPTSSSGTSPAVRRPPSSPALPATPSPSSRVLSADPPPGIGPVAEAAPTATPKDETTTSAVIALPKPIAVIGIGPPAEISREELLDDDDALESEETVVAAPKQPIDPDASIGRSDVILVPPEPTVIAPDVDGAAGASALDGPVSLRPRDPRLARTLEMPMGAPPTPPAETTDAAPVASAQPVLPSPPPAPPSPIGYEDDDDLPRKKPGGLPVAAIVIGLLIVGSAVAVAGYFVYTSWIAPPQIAVVTPPAPTRVTRPAPPRAGDPNDPNVPVAPTQPTADPVAPTQRPPGEPSTTPTAEPTPPAEPSPPAVPTPSEPTPPVEPTPPAEPTPPPSEPTAPPPTPTGDPVADGLAAAQRLMDTGRARQAEAQYRAVLRDAPENALAWLGLARASERLTRRRKAIHAYEQYVRFAPNAPDLAAVQRRIELLREGMDRGER